MRRFVQLFAQLDQPAGIDEKLEALVRYFSQAPDEDKCWTIALLSHFKPKRSTTTALLKEWAIEFAGIPPWLFEESQHIVDDLAETIALILPPPTQPNTASLTFWLRDIRQLAEMEEAQRRERVLEAWNQLEANERFIYNRLLTGTFRMEIPRQLFAKALAKCTGVEENILALRLMEQEGNPEEHSFSGLILQSTPQEDISKPYPFYLAHSLEEEPETLGLPSDWVAEHKWDGIRGQVIIRQNQLFVWSRGEELMTDKFPEFQSLIQLLPEGTAIDGEILPFKEGKLLPFPLLQTRIGRKNLHPGTLLETPVVFRAYDLLEYQGADLRHHPFHHRRALLETLFQAQHPGSVLQLSETLPFDDWNTLRLARKQSREYTSEGIMLKRKDSEYRAGRLRGDWWKWKADALNIDAVMIYAQQGQGKRGNLNTEFTFAVWNGNHLVPFTKAFSGLSDAELQEINAWIRNNILERFGPVRSVKPELVFEIAFEGIQASNRHKSGLVLRAPRIFRWRKDKPAREANTLEDLKKLLERYGS